MSAVNHPKHYNEHPSGIECIDIVEHMGFNLGNAMKYIWRADLKADAIEDLEKAKWYITREIEKRGKVHKCITVNAVPHMEKGDIINYERIAELAGKPGATHLTVTWHLKGAQGGSLIPGEEVPLREGMNFAAVHTGNA